MEDGKLCYANYISDYDDDDNYPNGNISTGAPPILVSRDYFYIWKSRMIDFLDWMDDDLLDTIKEGRFVPHIIIPGMPAAGNIPATPERYVVKEKSQWSEEDSRKVALDAKAKRFLMRSLPNDIFRFVMHRDTAKEMWDTLGVLLEETAKEKKYKRSLLLQQYELFSAKVGESLFDTYFRFNLLLNHLKRYDTTFDNEEMLMKFLESLPSVWSTITSVIRHVKDFSKMSLQDLYGNLLIHEYEIKQKQSRGKEKANMLSKCVATVKNLDTLIQSVGSNLKEKRRYYKYKAKYHSQKLKAKKGRNFVVEDADWSSTSSSD